MYIYDIECMLIHWNQNGYKGTIFWFWVFLKITPPPKKKKCIKCEHLKWSESNMYLEFTGPKHLNIFKV